MKDKRCITELTAMELASGVEVNVPAIVKIGLDVCPVCGEESPFRGGVHFDHQRRCPAGHGVWSPGALVVYLVEPKEPTQ